MASGAPSEAAACHRAVAGMQIDHVRELEVVTGKGAVVNYSMSTNPDLFEAMLDALGQCGIMAKARLDLVPAWERARTYAFRYTDTDTDAGQPRRAVRRGRRRPQGRPGSSFRCGVRHPGSER